MAFTKYVSDCTSDWITKIETVIDKASTEEKEIIMLGDFNFNLLKETSTTKQWLNTMGNLRPLSCMPYQENFKRL